MVCCHVSLTLFDVDYFYPSIVMVALDVLLIRELRELNLSDRKACG